MEDEEFPDHYALLGVSIQASLDEIRKAYWREAKFWFPDRFLGRAEEDIHRAETMMKKLNMAKSELLHSVEAKQDYDSMLIQWRAFKTVKAVVVSAFGDGNYVSIQDALDMTPDGVEIIVKRGVYNESLNIVRPVSIVGGDPPESVRITGQIGATLTIDINDVVIRGISISSVDAVGLFVRAGTPTISDCFISSEKFDAARIVGDSARPELIRCRIFGGKAGIAVSWGSEPTIRECEFDHIDEDAIRISDRAKPRIISCKIRNSGGRGIAIWGDAFGSIESCEITGSRGENVGVWGNAKPQIWMCEISDSFSHGLHLYQDSAGEITDCSFSGNGGEDLLIDPGANVSISNCRTSGVIGPARAYRKQLALPNMPKSALRGNRKTKRDGDEDIVTRLKTAGVKMIDKRPNGGALWIVGGVELEPFMSELRQDGFSFQYAPSGGRATSHRPSWFMRC